MSIRAGFVVSVAVLLTACGGSSSAQPGTPTPAVDDGTPASPVPTSMPANPPTQLRVAYLNLLSPIEVDANDQSPEQTYTQRLQIAIDELTRLGVDIAGFSEVTWKRELETPAWSILARGLQMEGSLVARANPWVAGQTREQSDASVQSFGWEEGEYLLSRYPILSSKRYALNPRTSESEGRAVLHAVVAAPDPIGEISVYVTRLAGDEETRIAQGKDLARIIAETREGRPMLLLADLASEPDSPVVQDLVARGYLDAGAATGLPTCCRETILVQSAPTPGVETPTAETTAEDTPTEEAPAETPASTPAANPTSTLRRTDYVFFSTWQVESFQLFANIAVSGADGSIIYASDHNGIAATFDLSASEDE